MVTTTYPAGQRPRIRVFDRYGKENPLPNLVLTKINSKSAYFRSSHVVGEMAISIDGNEGRGRVEIIRHADGTPILETEQWPPLTPYDTGERAQPDVWVLADRRRPEEHDPDRYGKVDFEDDASESILTAWVEKINGEWVLRYYTHGGDSVRVECADEDGDPLPAAVAGALEDRGHTETAAWVRQNEQEAWDRYIGPMLDEIYEESDEDSLDEVMDEVSQPGTGPEGS